LKFTTSLKKNPEFKRLYNKGKSAASQCVVIYCKRNGLSENRLGITVSKKVGGAVQRNRVRRRFKEIYRLNETKLYTGFDIVFVARVKSLDTEYSKLESSIIYLFRKLGIIKSCNDKKSDVSFD
jgi:ribonuclease P protein component